MCSSCTVLMEKKKFYVPIKVVYSRLTGCVFISIKIKKQRQDSEA